MVTEGNLQRMMTCRIEHIENRLVVGMKTTTTIMNISEDTKRLAKVFMPRRAEIKNRHRLHVFSIQNYVANFDPSDVSAEFDKWVAVEVETVAHLPEGMESFTIASGIYAVFDFKGTVSDIPKSRAYIFGEWLPQSGYQLDQRAHFEIMAEDYSKQLPQIEEELWIPIVKV